MIFAKILLIFRLQVTIVGKEDGKDGKKTVKKEERKPKGASLKTKDKATRKPKAVKEATKSTKSKKDDSSQANSNGKRFINIYSFIYFIASNIS